MSFKRVIKKVTCGILVTGMIISSVTGCGKKKVDNVKEVSNAELLREAQSIDTGYVYKQEDVEGIIGEGDEIRHIEYKGDKVRVISLSKDGKIKGISFNKDGSDVQSFDIPVNGNDIWSSYEFDKDGNLYMGYQVFKPEGDTPFRYLHEETERTGAFFAKYDSTGKELFNVDILEEYSDQEDQYIYELSWIEGYGLVFRSPRGIETYRDDSGFEVVIDAKTLQDLYGEWPCNLIAGGQGLLFASGIEGDNNEDTIRKIDLENKKIGDPSKALQSSNGVRYSYFGGVGQDLYAYDYEAIYGYDSKEDKLTKLLDFEDSDIYFTEFFNGIVAVSDTEFYATYNYEDDKFFNKFTKANPEDVADRIVITVGGLGIDNNILKAARTFNRTNDKYKIKLVKYGDQYDNRADVSLEEALNQFNMDIMAGNVPDVLCIPYYTNVNTYIDKGLLLDLAPAFNKGGALEDIELLPNVSEMMHTGDKMYSVFTTFTVDTLATRERFVEGKNSITYKDCDDLIKGNNTDYKIAFGFFDKEFMLQRAIRQTGNKVVDLKNKKCDFNSPEFIDLLNFANKFPTETDDAEEEESGYEIYAEDKALFYFNGIENFYDYAYLKHGVYNDEISFVGFPNNSGENIADIFPSNHMGVYSKTKYPDAAYEFIKTVFKESDQSITSAIDFPCDKALFEKMMQASTDPSSYEGETFYVGDSETDAQPLTQAEAQKLYDYILSIKSLYINEQTIEKIVTEEASAFFCGQKSAEDVAGIIQSRVTTYLNENG